MGHPRQTATCCICGATFEGSVWYALVSRYCSAACRNIGNKQTISTARRGETAAIVPSETKPARTKPMTDAEFAWLSSGGELPSEDRPMRRYLVERMARRRAA